MHISIFLVLWLELVVVDLGIRFPPGECDGYFVSLFPLHKPAVLPRLDVLGIHVIYIVELQRKKLYNEHMT